MVSFRGQKGFNVKFPTSIPPLFIWESSPPGGGGGGEVQYSTPVLSKYLFVTTFNL